MRRRCSELRATKYGQSEADQFAGIAVQTGELDVQVGATWRHLMTPVSYAPCIGRHSYIAVWLPTMTAPTWIDSNCPNETHSAKRLALLQGGTAAIAKVDQRIKHLQQLTSQGGGQRM